MPVMGISYKAHTQPMPQIKVTIDDEERTLEVPVDAITLGNGHQIISTTDLSQNYIPVAQTQGDDAVYLHRDSVGKRYKNYVNRSKAADDDTVVAAVLAKHGDAAKAEGLEEAKLQWRKTEYDPLAQERDTLKGSLSEFQDQVVLSAIDAAASKVWRNELATAPPGKQSWAQSNFKADGMWSKEQGEVIAVRLDADGNRVARPALEPTEGRQSMSMLEYMTMLAGEDAWKPYALPPSTVTTKPGGQTSPGAGTSTKPVSEWTSKEKADYVGKHGVEAFRALLSEGGVIA